MLPDGDLGRPCPPAWVYMQIPRWYSHAEGQWGKAMRWMAVEEGYVVERMFVDHDGRSDALLGMLELMPHSGVRALLVPSPHHLWTVAGCEDRTRMQLQEFLNLQIFTISDADAPVHPPRPALHEPGRFRWRHVRR